MSNKAFAINTANAVMYLAGAMHRVCPRDHRLVDRGFLARNLTSAVTSYIEDCEAWRNTYDPSRARNCTELRGVTQIRKEFDQHIRLLQQHGQLPFSREDYDSAVAAFNKVREWIVSAVAEYISVEEWRVCYTKAHTTTVTVELLGDYRILDWEYRRGVGDLIHDGELTEAHINHLVRPKGLKVKSVVDSVVLPTDETKGLNTAGDVMDVIAFERVSDLGGEHYYGRDQEVAEHVRRNNSDVLLTRVIPNQINSRPVGLFDDLNSLRLAGYHGKTPLGSAKQLFAVAFGNYPEITNKINKHPELRAMLRRMGWDGDVSKFTEEMAAVVLYGIHPDVYRYLRPINKPTGLRDEKNNLPSDTADPATVQKYTGFRFTATPRKSQ